jgi:hypothetical protein
MLRRRHNPLADYRIFLSPLYVVHRGAPLKIVNEIVAALGPTTPSITVLGTEHADAPLPSLRKLIVDYAPDLDDYTQEPAQFIVLLSRSFDGPTSRRTFAPIYKKDIAGIYLFRIEECEIDPTGDEHSEISVDLASLRGRSNRKRAILTIVPTPYRALCM